MKKQYLSFTRYLRSVFPNLPAIKLKSVEIAIKRACIGETFDHYDVVTTLSDCWWYVFDTSSCFVASNLTTPCNPGDLIGSIRPFFGSGNAVMATTANKPTLAGTDYATFNGGTTTTGTTHYLRSSFNFSVTEFSCFSVVRVASAGSYGTFFANINQDNSNGWYCGVGGSNNTSITGSQFVCGVGGTGGTGFAVSSATFSIATNTKRLVGYQKTNTPTLEANLYGSYDFLLNRTTGIPNNAISGGFQIGGYFTSGGTVRLYKGDLYSTLIANRNFTATERTRVSKFLNFYHNIGL